MRSLMSWYNKRKMHRCEQINGENQDNCIEDTWNKYFVNFG